VSATGSPAADWSQARVFIVVPAFNEGRTIRGVVESLRVGRREVVVVDDGSDDDTVRSLAGLPVHVLRHAINRGQGAALQTGIRFALRHGADVVVTFDSDGQHDAEDVARLVEPVARGECDIALGSRFRGRAINIPAGRWLVLKAGVMFTRLVSRIRVTDVHNGLRAFSRTAAAQLSITMDRMAHASEILEQIRIHGWRYCEVGVTVHYSAYSLRKGQRSSNAVRIALQMLADKLR